MLLPMSIIEFPVDGIGDLLREFSNLGHLLCFATLTYLLLGLQQLKQYPVRRRILIVLLSALVLGTGIELAQGLTLREPSLMDVIRDLAGALLINFLVKPEREQFDVWLRRCGLGLILMLFLYDSFFPALRLYDRQLATQQFPILSNLEQPTEALRWSRGERVTTPVREGHYALQVDFASEQYSTLSMNYLIRDWRGFSALKFSVFNPESRILNLYIKIHDREHRRTDQEYSDRYNQRVSIRPGWNEFSIRLSDIQSAPKTRLMDMDQIAMLQFFTHNLSQSQKLYFDAIQLVTDSQ